MPEAALWTLGLLAAQVLGGIVTAMVLVAGKAVAEGPGRLLELARDQRAPAEFFRAHEVAFFGGIQLFVVGGAVLAAWARLGRPAPRCLGVTRPPWRHLAVILTAFLPLNVLSTGLFLKAVDAWEALQELYPGLEQLGLDQLQAIETVKSLAEQTSPAVLFALIAVAPAIAEELIFRGVIGRGLVARWGVAGGIALSSVLFAAAHVYPPHAAALIPLAVFIHVSYLATRSIWAPMLVHLLNNGFAAAVLKYGSEFDSPLLDESTPPPLSLLVSAAVAVVLAGWYLWRTRVDFHLEGGGTWSPGYVSLEHPPASVVAAARCRRAHPLLWIGATGGLLVFLGVFAHLIVQHPAGP